MLLLSLCSGWTCTLAHVPVPHCVADGDACDALVDAYIVERALVSYKEKDRFKEKNVVW
jgi:hypothetical protein